MSLHQEITTEWCWLMLTTRGSHVLLFRINSKDHWKLFLDFDFLSFLSFLSFSCLSCNCLGACSCASKGEFREDVFDHIRREDLPMSLRGPFKCDHCDKGSSHLKKNGKKRGHCPLLATPPPKRVKRGHLLSDYRQKCVYTRDSYCGVKSPFLSDLRIR